MFQFTRFASHTYVFSMRYPCGWVSPFRNLRIKAYLPAPRSLSQAITSFVAYHRQGIHHMLLVTWPYNFDISFEMTQSSDRRLVLWGLAPHALCRNVNDLLGWFLLSQNPTLRTIRHYLNKQSFCLFVLTQSNLLLAARCSKTFTNFCFPLTTLISTLWIFKEQPYWSGNPGQQQRSLFPNCFGVDFLSR